MRGRFEPHHTDSFWLLALLAAEKVVQHAVVTWALLSDQFGIRESVAVNERWLVVAGAVIGALFALALIGLLAGRGWSRRLLAVLALADIAGEFIAQGRLGITLNVSFLVALAILLMLVLSRRQVGANSRGANS